MVRSEDNLPPPNLGEALVAKLSLTPNRLNPDSGPLTGFISQSPNSPTVQEKIKKIEKKTSFTSASDLANLSRIDKRKASPETAECPEKRKRS